MISELLSRRSLGSLNSLHDSENVPNFNDAFTIYGHPKVKDVLKGFEQIQAIQLPDYRAALKLRCVQKRMELHRVDIKDVISVLDSANLPDPDDEIGEADMEPIISDISLLTERNANTTTISCTDLVLTWILQMFDSNFSGSVTVRRFVLSIVVICGGRLQDKLKYLFDMYSPEDDLMDGESFTILIADMLMIPCSVFEEESYGHTHFVSNALYDCFNQVTQIRDKISLEDFLDWTATTHPHCMMWLFTFHRVMCSEYSIHFNSCSVCKSVPFLGFRYEGIHSYKLNVCQDCAWVGNTDGETELREFGTLGQCVNIVVEPMSVHYSTSFNGGTGPLYNYQNNLDADVAKIESYCKRLDPSSVNQFVSPSMHYILKNSEGIDDNIEALLGDYDDRATKLQKDYLALCRDHRDINKLERKDKLDKLQVWKQRDDLSCRLAVWMLRRTDLYIKQEDLLRDFKVDIPALKYDREQSEDSTLGSLDSVDSSNNKNSKAAEILTNKVKTEESVLVLSKLSLIINNVLLQKSISESPTKQPKRVAPDSPLMFENKMSSPENKAISNGFCNGEMKENITTNIKQNEYDVMNEFENVMNDIIIQENLTPPTYHKVLSLPSAISEKDKNKKEKISDYLKPALNTPPYGNTSADACDLTPVPDDVTPVPSPLKPVPDNHGNSNYHGNHINHGNSNYHGNQHNNGNKFDHTDAVDNMKFVENMNYERFDKVPSRVTQDITDEVITEEWETESDGSWETEEECTVNTITSDQMPSDPPTSLDLQPNHVTSPTDHVTSPTDHVTEEEVSEPECNPPDPATEEVEETPVPPPRTLLSPIGGGGRRATSLKTKEGDPKKDELRKVIRASSTAHRNKSFSTGIPTPTRTPSTTPISPSQTPPSRRSSGIPAPKSRDANTPELPARNSKTPSSSSSSRDSGITSSAKSGQYRELKKPTPVKMPVSRTPGSSGVRTPGSAGPYIDEGDSDSETSTSSDSSSDGRRKKSKFGSRARSARFARSRLPAPTRNAASFKAKRGSRPPTAADSPELGFANRFAE